MLFSIVVASLMACSMATCSAKSDFRQPDVLVLVMGGLSTYDMCSINYTTSVDLSTAQADLDKIAKLGNWSVSNARGETKPSGGPNSIPTTSITWQAQRIIGYSNGTLPLEPFITALRRFRYIEIGYIVPQSFRFNGLKKFENQFVNVHLSQAASSYRYRIVVKDNKFEKLDLPLTQPIESKHTGGKTMSTGARLTLALGVGILAAVAVYFITLYLSKRR